MNVSYLEKFYNLCTGYIWCTMVVLSEQGYCVCVGMSVRTMTNEIGLVGIEG